MILEGNLRAGAKNLATHLQKDENEHVDVHDLRGFVSEELEPAFKEIYGISKGTRAKKFMYSLSLNPPPGEKVATGTFRDAIEKVEAELGLKGQPRAIVFHIKDGRRHCHTVWSVIDVENMKAIHISYDKLKLMDISRALYQEHGWKMPRGFIRGNSPDPNNFTHGEWQQAKRLGLKPADIKKTIRDCWAASDCHKSFEAALKENGYFLANGRRGPVVIDIHLGIHSVVRAANVRTKEVRARLDQDSLIDVETCKERIASQIKSRLEKLQSKREQAIDMRVKAAKAKQREVIEEQRRNRKKLQAKQNERKAIKEEVCQKRFRNGFWGIVDFITGKNRKIREQNSSELALERQRDKEEMAKLLDIQLQARRVQQERLKTLNKLNEERRRVLSKDIKFYNDLSRSTKSPNPDKLTQKL